MARVICTSPNASENISGVAFEKTKHGMLSAVISDEQAALFASIRGYKLADDEGNPVEDEHDDEPGAGAGAAEDLGPLVARAKELGIAVKSNWKAARLNAEIKRAEEAASKAE